MPTRMRIKVAGALAPVAIVATLLTVALTPAPSAAATGSTVYSANIALSCLLAPGVLNVAGTVNATLQGTGPTSVAPGDSVSLTNVTTSLTTPAAWSTSFASLGATTAKGSVTNFVLDVAGGTPATVNAAASLGSGGLPYGPIAVVSGQPLTLTIPNSGPFTLAPPVTVTGASGDHLVLSVDTTPGFTGSTATGNGIVSNATGYNSSGTAVVGPLSIVCNAPVPAVQLGSIPISGAATTSSSSSTTSSSTTKTTTTTTTTTTPPPDIIIKFTNWTLSGRVIPYKLNQAIHLPPGSTFSGSADLTAHTITGNISVPPFTANMKLLGFIPTTVGLTFSQDGPATGTIGPDPNVSGNLAIAAVSKANLGVTSVGLFGLSLPVSCQTSTPVVFDLDTSVPALQLTSGATFAGTTTFPSVACTGALGALEGPLLSALFSGPGNQYSYTIAPPTTTTTSTTTTPSVG